MQYANIYPIFMKIWVTIAPSAPPFTPDIEDNKKGLPILVSTSLFSYNKLHIFKGFSDFNHNFWPSIFALSQILSVL